MDNEWIIAKLRADAEASSKVQRDMAEAKSLRNSNGESSDLYMWPNPEQTVSGQAADLIERLLTREEEVRGEERERAARIADAACEEASRIALMHPEDSDSRSRMFARAREARSIAMEIREDKSWTASPAPTAEKSSPTGGLTLTGADDDMIPTPRRLLAAAAHCVRKHAGRGITYHEISRLALSPAIRGVPGGGG